MTNASASQTIFERYLRDELSLDQTADALTDLMLERKASRSPMSDLSLRKPTGLPLTEGLLKRSDALFAEMNRRSSVGY